MSAATATPHFLVACFPMAMSLHFLPFAIGFHFFQLLEHAADSMDYKHENVGT